MECSGGQVGILGTLGQVADHGQEAYTDHNYQAFFNLTVETLVRPWEKMIMNMRFTEVGLSLLSVWNAR